MTNEDKIKQLKGLVGIETTDNSHDELLGDLLSLSEKIALSVIFPFAKDSDVLAIPTQYEYWNVLCAKEIWDKKEIGGSLKSYSENGISFAFGEARGLVSDGLLGLLTPKASVPRP